MENDEKKPHTTKPDTATQDAAANSNSAVGSEGSRYDLSSTQASFQDPDRLENQQSSPDRGEFGPHGHLGHTHGGYGNQVRNLTPEPVREAAPPSDTTAHYDGYQTPQGNGDNGLGMGGTTSQQNDNGSEATVSEGYSADYGNTSGGSPFHTTQREAADASTARNQHEDDHSSRGGYDNQGHPDDSNYRQPTPGAAAASGTASAQDEAGRPAPLPEEANAGAGSSYSGSTQDGHGSRGGSYNDEYDAANDKAQAGSPARGDYDSQDQSRNYGEASRQQNRPAGEKDTDYGATPKRAGTQEES